MTEEPKVRYRVVRDHNPMTGRDEAYIRVERRNADGDWFVMRAFAIAPSSIPKVLAELSAVGLDFHEEKRANRRAYFDATKTARERDA